MTKQEHNRIATILKLDLDWVMLQKNNAETVLAKCALGSIISHLMSYFEENDPTFDRQEFLKSIGYLL